MDDAVADETSGGSAVFRKGDGQGAQGVEGGTGFRILGLAMVQQGVEGDRHSNRRDGAGPTAPHGIGHGDAHARSPGEPVLLQIGEELFEVLDGDAAPGPAAGHAREVGGVDAELGHARLQPGRHVARAGGVGRNRQATDRWADRLVRVVPLHRPDGAAHGFVFRRLEGIADAEAGRFGGADFEDAELGSHGVAFLLAGKPLDHLAAGGRGHVHRGLAGLHLEHVLAGRDIVARLGEETDHDRLGDGFAQLRHDERDLGQRGEHGGQRRRRRSMLWATDWAVGRWAAQRLG